MTDTCKPVLARVLDSRDERRFPVQGPGGSYPVFVGSALLDRVGPWMREFISQGGNAGFPSFSTRCAVVTNPTVGALYGDRVAESLQDSGFDPHVITVPDGEQYKTLETTNEVYSRLLDVQLDRRSAVIALGGGVIGDMAGFAAATFMRGLPLVQMPTTLLAMVDASVGGKVAVDHSRGKNLIGAFKLPHAVLADVDTLKTLPMVEWRSGLAEVVKHAVIGDPGLFEQLEQGQLAKPGEGQEEPVADWLERAVRVKIEIVARDPFERGERAKLNLGHTFGHALEKLTHYQMRHGEGVAIGLVCAVRLAEQRGWSDPALTVRIERLLRKIGLPTSVPPDLPAAAIIAQMQDDKKRVDGHWRLVMPREIGHVVIAEDVGREEVLAVLEAAR